MKKQMAVIAVAVLFAGGAGSCAHVGSKEDYLANAGFQVMPGNSPGYAAALQQLPPHRFAHHRQDGVLTYYYLDPTICGCLYYGTAQDWAAYRQEVAEKLHLQAEEFLERADTPYSGHGGI